MYEACAYRTEESYFQIRAGSDKEDARSTKDILGKQAIIFYRTIIQYFPSLKVTNTEPFALLQDVFIGENKVTNPTYQQMFNWVIDKRDYPPEAGTNIEKQESLRYQVMEKFAERRIQWEAPFRVTAANGRRVDLTLDLRTFYGREDGTDEIRQAARNRYLEAFWYGDIFIYSGHSHFGNGPLEPSLYTPENFPARYQIAFINSCLSFNYYNRDFLTKKARGELDMVVNGMPSYVSTAGFTTAQFLISLLDKTPKSYKQILQDMTFDFSWRNNAYEPMRVVDGETDNIYNPNSFPLTLEWSGPSF